jgi:hypothetical protein
MTISELHRQKYLKNIAQVITRDNTSVNIICYILYNIFLICLFLSTV